MTTNMNDDARSSPSLNRAELYWDDQDPQNSGWWLRYKDEHGTEQGFAIDGDQNATTEELAADVAKKTERTGRIAVYRGHQSRGWIKVDGGTVVDWRAV